MANKEENKGMTVKKSDDFSEWYNEVVLKAGLAEHSVIRGFMVIKPAGYSIWEKIQRFFDDNIKAMGVKNAYFPLLIPEQFFKKEAEHAEGFAPELAWIKGKTDEGNCAIRPTSETIMYDSYSRWIRSWRDLPLKVNQWCNVLRWEVKQTKLFLRTREFLWQEGHCVYETNEECEKETLKYLEEYKRVAEDLLAIPVIPGRKTAAERFAGANETYTIEALMPDGKALQMGTSHNLGQNFAKAFDISFLGRDEEKQLPFQNSWGISTRMIGAVIMAHSDNKGLVLPPRLADTHAVIVPIYKNDTKDKVLGVATELQKSLGKKWNVHVDDREDYSPGWKFNEWELKGVPIRIEIGPKDIDNEQVVFVRRDTGKKEFIKQKDVATQLKESLDRMQLDLLDKAQRFLNDNIVECHDWNEFEKLIADRKLVLTPFCGLAACEEEIKDATGGATSRLIPFEQPDDTGNCVKCAKKAPHVVYFAKAY